MTCRNLSTRANIIVSTKAGNSSGASVSLDSLDHEAGVQGSDQVFVAGRGDLRCGCATGEEKQEFPGCALESNSGCVPESVAAPVWEPYLESLASGEELGEAAQHEGRVPQRLIQRWRGWSWRH